MVRRSLLALPTFSALRISNLVMLFSLQMQPIMSHVPQRLLARSFGQTARPKASPKCLQDSRPRPAFFTQMLEGFGPRPTWLSTDSGPRLECFPPRTGTSKHIFARVLAGFRSTALCFPIAGFRRPLKGFEGGDFGIYIRKHYCVKWTPSVQGTAPNPSRPWGGRPATLLDLRWWSPQPRP